MRQEGGPESIVRCGRRIAEEKAGRGEPMQFTFFSFHFASFPCVVVVGSVSTTLRCTADWGPSGLGPGHGARGRLGPGVLGCPACREPRLNFPAPNPQIGAPGLFVFPLRLFRAHRGPCSAPPCHPRWLLRSEPGFWALCWLLRPTARPFSLPLRDPTSPVPRAGRCAGPLGRFSQCWQC